MIELVADILASSATWLHKEQPTLSKFTSETDEYEPNLSFHYATILRRFLFWCDCDFDVVKPNFESRRPDIIFHKRGTQSLNFLAVEVKRSERDAEADIEKIKKNWFKEPLSYRFGASVVLGKNGSFRVQLLERNTGKEEIRTNNKGFNKLCVPTTAEWPALAELILVVKQHDAEADITGLERKMDQLVYAFYGLSIKESKFIEGATVFRASEERAATFGGAANHT